MRRPLAVSLPQGDVSHSLTLQFATVVLMLG